MPMKGVQQGKLGRLAPTILVGEATGAKGCFQVYWVGVGGGRFGKVGHEFETGQECPG